MTDTTIYEGDPWHADESEDAVRMFRGASQVFKAPKRSTDLAEYWPSPAMLRWMLDVMNKAEAEGNIPPGPC